MVVAGQHDERAGQQVLHHQTLRFEAVARNFDRRQAKASQGEPSCLAPLVFRFVEASLCEVRLPVAVTAPHIGHAPGDRHA